MLLQRDGWLMLSATAIFIGVAVVLDEISRITGAIFLAALLGYIVLAFVMARRNTPAAQMHKAEAKLHEPAPAPLWQSASLTVAGLAMLIFGADLLGRGARYWGVLVVWRLPRTRSMRSFRTLSGL